MPEHLASEAGPVTLAVVGPGIARVGLAAVWRVEVRDALGHLAPGVEVVAQLGHGAGRPFRAVTNADGVAEFVFTFSTPSPAIELQFAAASELARRDRFPDHEHRESVTCAVTTADTVERDDVATSIPGHPHAPTPVRKGAAVPIQD